MYKLNQKNGFVFFKTKENIGKTIFLLSNEGLFNMNTLEKINKNIRDIIIRTNKNNNSFSNSKFYYGPYLSKINSQSASIENIKNAYKYMIEEDNELLEEIIMSNFNLKIDSFKIENILKHNYTENKLEFLKAIKFYDPKKSFYLYYKNNLIIFNLDDLDYHILGNYDDKKERGFSLRYALCIKNVSPSLLLMHEIISNNKTLYNRFVLHQPNKDRVINAPIDDLKDCCKVILNPLNKAFEKRNSYYQYAYIKGKNIKNNADIHKYNKSIIKFDIAHFFDSCKWKYCYKYISFLYDNLELPNRYENILKEDFKKVLINPETNGLYMGNPLSGIISNMIMNPVVNYIGNIIQSKLKEINTNRCDIKFSLYADDFTFSGSFDTTIEYDENGFKLNTYFEQDLNNFNSIFNKKYLSSIIRTALDKYELTDICLKNEKTLRQNNQRRKITGLRVNHNDKLTVQRCKYDLMKSYLHHLSLNDDSLTITNQQLEGLLNYYLYVDETDKFKKLVTKYENTLKKNKIHIPEIIYLNK